MNFWSPFKKLPAGYYRLYIVGWVFVFIFGMYYFDYPGLSFLKMVGGGVILSVPYYVCGRLLVWVYLGFKESS